MSDYYKKNFHILMHKYWKVECLLQEKILKDFYKQLR